MNKKIKYFCLILLSLLTTEVCNPRQPQGGLVVSSQPNSEDLPGQVGSAALPQQQQVQEAPGVQSSGDGSDAQTYDSIPDLADAPDEAFAGQGEDSQAADSSDEPPATVKNAWSDDSVGSQDVVPTAPRKSTQGQDITSSENVDDVEVKLKDGTVVKLDRTYLDSYPVGTGDFVQRSRAFSDQFSQDVYVLNEDAENKDEGVEARAPTEVMYSLDLQWKYIGQKWVPVEYSMETDRKLVDGTVVESKHLKIKIEDGSLIVLPQTILEDSAWNSQMENCEVFVGKPEQTADGETRVESYNAYLDFLQAAAPVEHAEIRSSQLAPKKQKVEQHREMVAARPVQPAPVAAPPQPVNITLNLDEPEGKASAAAAPTIIEMPQEVAQQQPSVVSGQPQGSQTGSPTGPQQIIFQGGKNQSQSSQPPSTTVVVQGSGSGQSQYQQGQTGALFSNQSSGSNPTATGPYGVNNTYSAYTNVIGAGGGTNPVELTGQAMTTSSGNAFIGSGLDGKLSLDALKAQCTAIVSNVNIIRAKMSNYSSFTDLSVSLQFAFFNIKGSKTVKDLSLVTGVYQQMLDFAKKLQDLSNVFFYAVQYWSDDNCKAPMTAFIQALIDMLTLTFSAQDLSADSNNISVLTMFKNTSTLKGGSEALYALFDVINQLFTTLFQNHGLLVWMVSLGQLDKFSKMMRNSVHICKMPNLQINTTPCSAIVMPPSSSSTSGQVTIGGSTYSSGSSSTTSSASSTWIIGQQSPIVDSTYDGFPGYHGNGPGLYNAVATKLQAIFESLHNNYSRATITSSQGSSKIGLLDVMNSLFAVVEDKGFISFELAPGFEERFANSEKYPELQALVSDPGLPSSTDPNPQQSRIQLYMASIFAPDIAAGVMRELIVNKIVYLLGLVNTEVFQISGKSLKDVFSAHNVISSASTLDDIDKVSIGCLNNSLGANFLSQISVGKSTSITNFLLRKDSISQAIYKDWLAADEKNNQILTGVYGSTSLDVTLINALNTLFKSFRSTMGASGFVKNFLTKQGDPRITVLQKDMTTLGGNISDSRFTTKFIPEVFPGGYSFWPITAQVSKRIMKILLLYYGAIEWYKEGTSLSTFSSSTLMQAFQNLSKVIVASTFFSGIMKDSYFANNAVAISTTIGNIASATNLTTLGKVRYDKNLAKVSVAMKDVTELCGQY